MKNQAGDWDNGIEYACLTSIGMRRANNQDALAAVVAPTREQWLERGHLFMVADGMGAHAAGELASKLAVDIVTLSYDKLREQQASAAIKSALETANEKIHSRGEANPEFKGMGTTASVLLLLPQGAVVGHVGDSRVYRLRGNRLEQLSFDHSLVWEMQASGQITEQGVPKFVPKNIITRSLGPNSVVNVDLEGPFPLAVGDAFLVCSDGLSGQLEDEEIGVIMGCLAPGEAAQVLVDLANLRGGPDNITVCVARVVGSQITQVAAPPLGSRTISSPNSGKEPASPIAWAVLGIFSLAAVMLGIIGWFVGAAVALVATIVMAAIMAAKWSSGNKAESAADATRLGSGPHTTRVCTVSREFVDRLSKTVGRLSDAARGQDWTVDWHRYNQLCDAAVTAGKQDDHAEAVLNYYRAIQHMMGELRGQNRRDPTESAADADRPEAT